MPSKIQLSSLTTKRGGLDIFQENFLDLTVDVTGRGRSFWHRPVGINGPGAIAFMRAIAFADWRRGSCQPPLGRAGRSLEDVLRFLSGCWSSMRMIKQVSLYLPFLSIESGCPCTRELSDIHSRVLVAVVEYFAIGRFLLPMVPWWDEAFCLLRSGPRS